MFQLSMASSMKVAKPKLNKLNCDPMQHLSTNFKSKCMITQLEVENKEEENAAYVKIDYNDTLKNAYLHVNITDEYGNGNEVYSDNSNEVYSEMAMKKYPYDKFFNQHENMLNEWNINTNALNNFSVPPKKVNAVNAYDDEKILSDHDSDIKDDIGVGSVILEQNAKYNTMRNRQSNKVNTVDTYLLQLLKTQNELHVLRSKAEEMGIATKKVFDESEKKYQPIKKARIDFQKTIEEQVKKLNEIMANENELFSNMKTAKKQNDAKKDEICKLKISIEQCMSLIDKYVDFVAINNSNIDKINSYFQLKWGTFESNWCEWTVDDIVAWCEYKTQSMNTSNIEWNEIKKELRKRNMCGESLSDITGKTLYMIGMRDLGIKNFIFKNIMMLRSEINEFPTKFICPISKQIMSDPVIAFDAYTYEREAIKEYLKIHKKSPVTNMMAFTTKLFPNISLQKEIKLFNNVMKPNKTKRNVAPEISQLALCVNSYQSFDLVVFYFVIFVLVILNLFVGL